MIILLFNNIVNQQAISILPLKYKPVFSYSEAALDDFPKNDHDNTLIILSLDPQDKKEKISASNLAYFIRGKGGLPASITNIYFLVHNVEGTLPAYVQDFVTFLEEQQDKNIHAFLSIDNPVSWYQPPTNADPFWYIYGIEASYLANLKKNGQVFSELKDYMNIDKKTLLCKKENFDELLQYINDNGLKVSTNNKKLKYFR